jgi:FkbM family methyltransferase
MVDDLSTPAQATFPAVVKNGANVLIAFRREFESTLWRREAWAQGVAVLRGRRPGYVPGRDHDGLRSASYAPRGVGPRLWLRHGSGDAAVYGEIFVRGAYAPPWILPDGLRVLDLGAHIGFFARWALEQWNVESLISVEPDVDNYTLLARNRDALGDARWTLVAAAAGCAEGRAAFAGGRGCGSGLADAGEDDVRTVDALELMAGCDLAKLDVEGGEWALLRDARFPSHAPRLICVEYHPAEGVARPDVEARRLLTAAGYDVVDGHRETESVGVLWGRRRGGRGRLAGADAAKIIDPRRGDDAD